MKKIFFLLILFQFVFTCLFGVTKTWTGGSNDGLWNSGGNWSPSGKPTMDDDVIIGKHKGPIKLSDDPTKMKGLTLGDTSILQPVNGAGNSVNICAFGSVEIGVGAIVRGNAGGVGNQNGGSVKIESTGNTINRGTIQGADADNNSNSSSCNGGSVTLGPKTGMTNGFVFNEGSILGGAGGTKLAGNSSTSGGKGGNVTIKATLEIDNRPTGIIKGGSGGDKTGGDAGNGGDGGSVSLECEKIDNQGSEEGGNAGKRTGGTGGGSGGKGGSVNNNADPNTGSVRGGKKRSGTKGTFTGGTGRKDGKNGITSTTGANQASILPGDYHFGDNVTIATYGSQGTILLANLPANSIVADDYVCIHAGSNGVIDLTGIPSGTNVITAGNSISLFGTVLLDQGVQLADITEPDAIIANCFSISIPTLSQWGIIIFSLLLLSIGMVFVTRRQNVLVLARSISQDENPYLFDKSLYFKVLGIVLLLSAIVLAVLYLYYGELTKTDTVGTLVCASIVAFMIQVWMLMKRK